MYKSISNGNMEPELEELSGVRLHGEKESKVALTPFCDLIRIVLMGFRLVGSKDRSLMKVVVKPNAFARRRLD
ncbi:hypothetical protein N665_0412s0023 [Sinapis alba]|nr:hypothetical protein N665_0412s0023 [Sinapis alba]